MYIIYVHICMDVCICLKYENVFTYTHEHISFFNKLKFKIKMYEFSYKTLFIYIIKLILENLNQFKIIILK